MSGVATAIVGGAIIGGIASNKAAGKSADAMDRATDANAWQGQIAQDQWNDYKSTYQPLEHQLAVEATQANSPAEYNRAASEAQATVASQLGQARERLARTPGFDPSSAAATAALADLETKGAAVGATAQNSARDAVRDKAYARKLDVVGLGKGLVTGASTGMANAAATAQGIANSQSNLAGQTAAGIGSMVSGSVNALSKLKFGGAGLNGYTPDNQYSGGNDGWTMPNGESIGT